jgi:hypothetical protein
MPRKKTATPIAKAIVGAKPAVIKNRIVLALDTSGSMGGLRHDVQRAVNDMLDTIQQKTEQEGQQTDVAIVTFDTHAEVHLAPTRADLVPPLRTYPIRGSTALNDGVALGAETIDTNDPDTSYLVLTFTDGGENNSHRYRGEAIRKFIAQRQRKGNWTFAFQVPRGDRLFVAGHFGVPLENVREWEQTRAGVEDVRMSTQSAIGTYFGARKAGERSMKTFYDVVTDLSTLKAKTVKTALDDISDRFRVLTVAKEATIKEFVEGKTRRAYVIGAGFYQLTKTEKVQPQKAVLIMEKGKQAVWGGRQARDLIGLPSDGVSHAKVTPGDHSKYDIFVQSTSVNRKLVRGTKVLVDTGLTRGLKPTWDHLAVASK